jgi:hypothetical protein
MCELVWGELGKFVINIKNGVGENAPRTPVKRITVFESDRTSHALGRLQVQGEDGHSALGPGGERNAGDADSAARAEQACRQVEAETAKKKPPRRNRQEEGRQEGGRLERRGPSTSSQKALISEGKDMKLKKAKSEKRRRLPPPNKVTSRKP